MIRECEGMILVSRIERSGHDVLGSDVTLRDHFGVRPSLGQEHWGQTFAHGS